MTSFEAELVSLSLYQIAAEQGRPDGKDEQAGGYIYSHSRSDEAGTS